MDANDLARLLPTGWIYYARLREQEWRVGGVLFIWQEEIDFEKYRYKKFTSEEECKIWCDMMNFKVVSGYYELIKLKRNSLLNYHLSA